MPSDSLQPADPRTSILLSYSDVVQALLQKGPLGVLALGGGWALWRGLFSTFELHEAAFGASLLVLATVSDMFVWMVTLRGARRRSEKKDQEALAARDAEAEAEKRAPHS